MHGRKKLERDAKQRKHIEKRFHAVATKYRSCTESLHILLKSDFEADSLFSLTGEILKISPNVKYMWNLRKTTLLKLKERIPPDDFDAKCHEELVFAQETCLPVDHKSYSTWFQMIYVLQQMHSPDFDTQLKLTEKFLSFDERNFHCWNYRRFLLSKIPKHEKSELEYTEKLLRRNQNNFSAWHQRTCILKDAFEADFGTFEENIRYELNLVLNALYTNPDEESCWLYLRWLFSRGYIAKKDITFASCFSLKKGSGELIISLSEPSSKPDHKIIINNNENKIELNSAWISCDGSSFSNTWFCNIEYDFKLNHSSNIVIDNGFKLFSLKLVDENYCIRLLDKTFLSPIKLDLASFKEELSMLHELLDMEDQNVHAICLRIDFLLSKHTDESEKLISSLYDKLIHIDVKRKGFYETMKSEASIINMLMLFASGDLKMDEFESLYENNLPRTRFLSAHIKRAKINSKICMDNFVKMIPACVFDGNCAPVEF